MRTYHLKCVKAEERPPEREDGAAPIAWLCADCEHGVHVCLLCNRPGKLNQPGDSGVFKCGVRSCGRFYHKKCAEVAELASAAAAAACRFNCPLHYCKVCRKSAGEVGHRSSVCKCLRCPNGVHDQCLAHLKRYVRKGRMMVCDAH
ncbi:unnamed protein product, partial [Phaeothamnion confervicola]